MKRHSNIFIFCTISAVLFFSIPQVSGQTPTQIIKGKITDRETRVPLPGANIIVLNSSPLLGTVSDSLGKFSMKVPIGRISIRSTFLGYEDVFMNDILISSGKEVELNMEMTERVINKKEIVITALSSENHAINQMATISAQTIRTDDALRFAGGFYDPSRIVNSFAGVTTANNDESNDIVIRGNSSRGLLWRLEGIEIPNPNHFGDGQGGSGGAYSAISSNVISNFDFFTSAFPAEYGNAISGVMDLSLKKGNADNYEFALQTGMIGIEAAAEGPLNRKSGSSFLINSRYVNFSYLSKLGLIDLGSTNYAPRSEDIVFNLNFPGRRSGSYNVFGFYGGSALGTKAIDDKTTWQTDNDRWEEIQRQGSSVIGIRHLQPLRGGDGFVRTIVAFTNFLDSYSEGYVDSSYLRTDSYHHNYQYPSLRTSVLLNNKISSKDIIRTGMNLHLLVASMDQWRRSSSGLTTPLVAPYGAGLLQQFYTQLKHRVSENFEINSGIHIMIFTVNGDISLEPRLGLRWQILPGKFLVAGAGLHSRIESFPVYYNSIKSSSGKLEPLNKDLGFSKSFQLVSGFDFALLRDLRLKAEIYYQHLYSVPIIDNPSSTYSSINTAESLPSSDLVNKGLGYNRGLELTLEKLFSNNYYFLITGSLFESKYKPGNKNWYNTYYNTGYVSNLLAGKDFLLGKGKRNSLGINIKSLFRGGYRYTPVDITKTSQAKRIIYDVARTYGSKLPGFARIDGGINFRRNNSGYSWIILLDVQNITGRKNVFRKKFSYRNGEIITDYDLSIGMVPVFNFRIEF